MYQFTPIESKRLILRCLQESDFKVLHAYRNDEEVAKFQSWEDRTEEEIRKLIKEQQALQPGIPGEWFMFAIELKETGELIGDCAFNVCEGDNRQAELGITLHRAVQKKGYAREAITAVLKYSFENLSVERVNLITYKENQCCLSLIAKLDILPVKDTNLAFAEGEKTDQELYGIKDNEIMYAITKTEWLEKPPVESESSSLAWLHGNKKNTPPVEGDSSTNEGQNKPPISLGMQH
jgi:RimJ/RimL family protein N-acetyltransferase